MEDMAKAIGVSAITALAIAAVANAIITSGHEPDQGDPFLGWLGTLMLGDVLAMMVVGVGAVGAYLVARS